MTRSEAGKQAQPASPGVRKVESSSHTFVVSVAMKSDYYPRFELISVSSGPSIATLRSPRGDRETSRGTRDELIGGKLHAARRQRSTPGSVYGHLRG
ncbi:hypothetical protein EYF80_026576 [Liparis tanakae]|uniref:Uncharacterized protein n=1 Tax=Liparis tanakae TaxID=230148 RepID=A0A4Z2HDZ5_9TELE|nr:hypothetical protein EYF80_026576 [Liparis tanakae]